MGREWSVGIWKRRHRTQHVLKALRWEKVQCVQGTASRLGWLQQSNRRVVQNVVRYLCWRPNYGGYNFHFKYDENLSCKSTVFSEHLKDPFFTSQNLSVCFNVCMPWIVLMFCFSFFIFNQIRLHLFELTSEVEISHLGKPSALSSRFSIIWNFFLSLQHRFLFIIIVA